VREKRKKKQKVKERGKEIESGEKKVVNSNRSVPCMLIVESL